MLSYTNLSLKTKHNNLISWVQYWVFIADQTLKMLDEIGFDHAVSVHKAGRQVTTWQPNGIDGTQFE